MTSLKRLLLALLSLPPVPRILQRLLRRSGVSIFTYHGVVARDLLVSDWSFLSASAFDRQMKYLSKNFQVLPLGEAFQLQGSGQLPQGKPVAVVTFDDGFYNNYSVALPILKKYAIPATIFLATDYVGAESTSGRQSANELWFCRLHSALMAAMQVSRQDSGGTLQWEGQAYPISTIDECRDSSFRLQQALKPLRSVDLEREVSNICQELGVETDELPEFKMLDKAAIQALTESGLILFGAHTGSHAILARLSKAEQEVEVGRSVTAVSSMTGQPCTLFAYPNGGCNDYNDDTVKILEEHGIEQCVTMVPGQNRAGTPRLELRRYGVGATDSFPRFVLQAHHLIAQG